MRLIEKINNLSEENKKAYYEEVFDSSNSRAFFYENKLNYNSEEDMEKIPQIVYEKYFENK